MKHTFDHTGGAVSLSWLIQATGNGLFEMIDDGASADALQARCAELAGGLHQAISHYQVSEAAGLLGESTSREVAMRDADRFAFELRDLSKSFSHAVLTLVAEEMMTRDHAERFFQHMASSGSSEPPTPAQRRAHLRLVPKDAA